MTVNLPNEIVLNILRFVPNENLSDLAYLSKDYQELLSSEIRYRFQNLNAFELLQEAKNNPTIGGIIAVTLLESPDKLDDYYTSVVSPID